jgi:2-hydroxychromene-2-carboxylate isomerase/heme-degrading monooxygenase HmoA
MILEVAILDVKRERAAEFEASFAVARAILRASPGYVSHELRRRVEAPGRYVLLVRWRSLDDHVEGFRKSAGYQEWKRLLHHFYDPFPTVEHFEPIAAVAPGRVVEFFFSPGSRYCYLAASQMKALEGDTGCRIDWRPVNGADIRELRGRDPFAGVAVSGQYEWKYRRRDAERWARAYGIPFREPPDCDFDFDLLARAAMAGRRLGSAAEYGWALCSAVYGSDAWPIDRAVCRRIAGECGLRVAAFDEALEADETRRALASAAAEAHGRGAFGVPTFFVGEEMLWGNDRVALLKSMLLEDRAG